MDIKAEKLALIEWLAGINDSNIIKRFQALKRSSEELGQLPLSAEEKNALDQGLKSIKAGKVMAHEDVIAQTKAKFPQLYK